MRLFAAALALLLCAAFAYAQGDLGGSGQVIGCGPQLSIPSAQSPGGCGSQMPAPGGPAGGGGGCTPTGLKFNINCNSQYVAVIH